MASKPTTASKAKATTSKAPDAAFKVTAAPKATAASKAATAPKAAAAPKPSDDPKATITVPREARFLVKLKFIEGTHATGSKPDKPMSRDIEMICPILSISDYSKARDQLATVSGEAFARRRKINDVKSPIQWVKLTNFWVPWKGEPTEGVHWKEHLPEEGSHWHEVYSQSWTSITEDTWEGVAEMVQKRRCMDSLVAEFALNVSL